MVTFSQKRKALTLFKNKLVSKSTVRHNVVQWLKAVEYLGEKWVLANKVTRLKKSRKTVRKSNLVGV